jgi:hypothetical protein
MKPKHTLLYCISLFLVFSTLKAQTEEIVTDTIQPTTKYGLRIGADLAKPLRTVLDENYSGFEIMGDFRFSDRFYVAAELGNESKDYAEINLNAKTSGNYIKLGADFNAYNNWFGLNNAIFGGLRYGFSTFKQELLSYSIYTTDQTFPTDLITESTQFKGLTAHWAELIVGVKTEIANNLYLSINLQLKRRLSEDKPEGFDNLFIPGFSRTYDFSDWGAGYGYTISYLIPIFRK